MYTYLLYSAGRFRRMKEQGEVIFLFNFSFVHSLEISPDLELIVTDCCELAVLRFSTTYDLGMIIVLLAMRCILIKHNVHIGVSASKGKKVPSTNISNNNSFIRSNTARSSHCESNKNNEQRHCSSVLGLQAVFGDFKGQRNVTSSPPKRSVGQA